MTERRITRQEYDTLLTNDLPSTAPEALDRLGLLIDAAHAHHDASGTQRAITIACALTTSTWTSAQRAMLHFFLANANDDLRSREAKSPEERWNWTSPYFDASLLHLRQATNEPSFTDLPAEVQCKILTNLGNNLSTIGRYIEAQEPWNHALAIDSTFPMARANRGYGRFHYAKTLHDPDHREAFLHLAHEDLRTSNSHIPNSEAKKYFAGVQAQIERIAPATYWEQPHDFRTFPLGDTDEEITYRTWALKRRLFLNPINDLTTQSVAAADVIHTPNMIVPLGEPPIYQGFFNQLKQEYTTARYLLDRGLHTLAPTYADRDVLLLNTLDYPAYGTNLELVKLAYRSLYSLFDKIAYFLNSYLKLNIPEKRVNFRTLWHEKEDPTKPLKARFTNYANLPLRGLYWISRDLDEKAERHLATDASALNTIRQHLEHKYLKTHSETAVPAEWTDTLAHNVQRNDLEAKTLRLVTIARAALLYLILGITVEEQHRREQRGDKKVPGTELPQYDDRYKR
ncbi:MAG: LA2681 family HEPN domain-containing protein [Acidobacteriota bacterium]